jgi:hypothetical protein
VIEPPDHLPFDPRRSRGLGRSEEDQKARPRKGLFDRGPQMRRRREAGVVPKQPQCPTPIPCLPELLNDRLQGRRDRLVLGVAVGNESVVRHPAAAYSSDTAARVRCERPGSVAHGERAGAASPTSRTAALQPPKPPQTRNVRWQRARDIVVHGRAHVIRRHGGIVNLADPERLFPAPLDLSGAG